MSYEEHEALALETGDWTLVERLDVRRAKKQAFIDLSNGCAALQGDYILYCDTIGTRAVVDDCFCTRRSDAIEVLRGRF